MCLGRGESAAWYWRAGDAFRIVEIWCCLGFGLFAVLLELCWCYKSCGGLALANPPQDLLTYSVSLFVFTSVGGHCDTCDE